MPRECSRGVGRQRPRGKDRSADNGLGAPEPAERDLAQAAPHRIADDQRAREHRGCRRNAEQHGQIRPPVEREAAGDEGQAGHAERPVVHLDSVAETAPASATLCVTTMSMVWRAACRSSSSDATASAADAIEVARRLVAQEQHGIADQRAREGGPLLLAPGQLRRAMIQSIGEARPGRGAHGHAPRPPSRCAPDGGATSVGASTFSRTEHCGSSE